MARRKMRNSSQTVSQLWVSIIQNENKREENKQLDKKKYEW